MLRFGARVTVVEMSDRLVAPEEPEASELITEIVRREGMEVHTGATIERVEASGDGGATVYLAGGDALLGRADAGRHRATQRPGLPRSRHVGARHRRPCRPRRRQDAGAARGVGGRRHHREGRLHPRGHVPGPALRGRRPRHAAARSRLPRAAPGHLHRSRDRVGWPHRGPGPRGRGRRDGVLGADSRSRPAAGSTAARASSSSSPGTASSSGRRPWPQRGARCSVSSRSPCTPGSRSRPCAP